MTKLLVSVRNADEAATALAAGVDLVDVKEPGRGPLGRADAATIASIVERVAGHRLLSAAMGELADWDGARVPEITSGLNFVKFGLSRCADRSDWILRWRDALGALPARTAAVAVVYADYQRATAPDPSAVVDAALAIGCRAVLVDTFDKSAGSLVEHWSRDELRDFAQLIRRHRLMLALAGKLTVPTIRRLLPLDPDYIAVRSAVCTGGRNGPISGERIRELAAMLHRLTSPCSHA